MLLEFQTLFSGFTNIMDSVYRGWVDGVPQAGPSIHLNRKAAIVCSLKCTDSHNSPARPVRSLTAVRYQAWPYQQYRSQEKTIHCTCPVPTNILFADMQTTINQRHCLPRASTTQSNQVYIEWLYIHHLFWHLINPDSNSYTSSL